MPLSYLPPGPAKLEGPGAEQPHQERLLGVPLWGLGLSCLRAVYSVSREVPAVARMPRHLPTLSLYA